MHLTGYRWFIMASANAQSITIESNIQIYLVTAADFGRVPIQAPLKTIKKGYCEMYEKWWAREGLADGGVLNLSKFPISAKQIRQLSTS